MYNNSYLFTGVQFELPWGAVGLTKHSYTLTLVDGPRKVDEIYGSRIAATSRMYKLARKMGLNICKVYDDKHDKTYICENGATFHVNRM